MEYKKEKMVGADGLEVFFTCSHCSYLRFFIKVKYITPAQFTRRSIFPSSFITLEIAPCTASRFTTSHGIATPRPGTAASAFSAVMLLDNMNTFAPSAPKALDTARPI